MRSEKMSYDPSSFVYGTPKKYHLALDGDEVINLQIVLEYWMKVAAKDPASLYDKQREVIDGIWQRLLEHGPYVMHGEN
jgi:hypothetical protein